MNSAAAKAIFDGPKEPGLLDWNMADLLDHQAACHGESIAVASLHQSIRRTYGQLRNSVQKLAVRLLESGIRPGGRIVVLAGNCIEFIEIFFAAAAIGAICVIVTPNFSVEEFQDAVNTVEPTAIFVAERIGFRSNSDILHWAAETFDGPVIVIGSSTKASPTKCGVSLEAFVTRSSVIVGIEPPQHGGSRPELKMPFWGKNLASEPCCFQFTSGTTGARKASMLSHHNLINNARMVGHQLGLSTLDKLCCCPPLSHCFGLVCGLLASYLNGGTLVIPSEIFNPAVSVKALRDEGCTVIHAVPSMFEALLKQEQRRSPKEETPIRDFQLRTGIIAGATPPYGLLRSIDIQLGLRGLLYPFGMTELSAVCLCTSFEDSLIADNTSVGTVMPHVSIKVVDEQGQLLPVDVPGELCVSGYLVHLGYYRNELKTKESLWVDDSGRSWLRTGDIASLDQNGRCRVVGRSKDMIKKHGENITPKDIEDALMAYPSVSQAAVVGVPHEKHGESIVAFVELQSRGTVEEKSLRRWLRERKLSPYKMPDVFISIGDMEGGLKSLPINTSGKVLKTELRSFARVHAGGL